VLVLESWIKIIIGFLYYTKEVEYFWRLLLVL